MPPHFRVLAITIGHTTLISTPLEVEAARDRDLYMTTHNAHKRHPCPWRDSNPQTQQASKLLQTHAFRPRGHWDQLKFTYWFQYVIHYLSQQFLLRRSHIKLGSRYRTNSWYKIIPTYIYIFIFNKV
jgi:hypothetical protein